MTQTAGFCVPDLPVGLTDEVVGASQVVVPDRHLQALLSQLRQRDLIEELLQGTQAAQLV